MGIWETLPPRGREVAECLLEGLDNDAIHTRLGIAKRTVKAHMQRMFAKAGLMDSYSERKYLPRIRLARILWEERYGPVRKSISNRQTVYSCSTSSTRMYQPIHSKTNRDYRAGSEEQTAGNLR